MELLNYIDWPVSMNEIIINITLICFGDVHEDM